jgi:O-antigen ligase
MALPLGIVQVYGQVHARVSATMRTSTERVVNCAVRASGPVALMVMALAVMAWTAWTGLAATPAGATTTLWGSWDDTWNLIRDFQPAGTGLNTYGTAMMVFQPALHPGAGYNSYLQFAAEGGLLLLVPAALTLLLFGWQVVRRFVERRDGDTMRWIRTAAVAGLALVALYEVVGLSLQVPGNAALFAVLGGISVRR